MTDTWTAIRDRYRKPEPTRWQRLVAWGEAWKVRHPHLSYQLDAIVLCAISAVLFAGVIVLSTGG